MTTETPTPATDEPRDWFFTFGGNHVHPDTSQNLGNAYVRIHGTEMSARTAMTAAFGRRWAFQYDDEEVAGIARFGLFEVALPKVGVR